MFTQLNDQIVLFQTIQFRIPQNFSITRASASDCLMIYPGHSLGKRSYSSAEMLLVYSTTPANWSKFLGKESSTHSAHHFSKLSYLFKIIIKIDNSQYNSKYRLFVDRDKMINPITEFSILAQKEYKTRHNLVGKVIPWELCKRLKFDHSDKWHIHKTAIFPKKWDP